MAVHVGVRGPGHLSRGGGFSLDSLFASGTYAGFDFTDLDPAKTWGAAGVPLLWRPGSATTVAVSASGQSFGHFLDKSQGLALGAEILANPGFDSDTGWTKGTGWTISGGKAAKADSAASDIKQTGVLTTGHSYLVSLDIDAIGSGSGVDVIASWSADYTRETATGTRRHVARTDADTAFYITGGQVASTPNRTATVDNASVKRIFGNHAYQSTSAARPAYTESGALKYLLCDGVDDYLLSTLNPAASMTVAACVRNPSSAASTQLITGSNAAAGTRNSHLALLSTGQMASGWGTDDGNTIKGGPTGLWDTDLVLLLRANASAVELWLGVAGSVTRVYAAAPNGTPNTTIPLGLGGLNNNGTPSTFYAGRIYRAAAVQRFIPDADVIPLMRALVPPELRSTLSF